MHYALIEVNKMCKTLSVKLANYVLCSMRSSRISFYALGVVNKTRFMLPMRLRTPRNSQERAEIADLLGDSMFYALDEDSKPRFMQSVKLANHVLRSILSSQTTFYALSVVNKTRFMLSVKLTELVLCFKRVSQRAFYAVNEVRKCLRVLHTKLVKEELCLE